MNLIEVSTWFTLFFIPVIPYERKRLLLCPVCQHGMELDRAEFSRLRPLAQLGLLFAEGKITSEDYLSRLGAASEATLEPWDGKD
ncbi:MAG: hypothetical protein KAW89_08935 [Armatimonadetes bacterium]|nr:hypothetical protein [Armatimonadota bacterium]